jgi:hypothetical protein
MDAHTKVAGAWKKLNAMHVNVSSTWKEVTAGYIKVSGAWKQFYANISITAGARGESADTGNFTVGFRFNRDGSVEKLSNGSWVSSGVWITGGTVPATIGDDYEIEVTWQSGDTETQPVLADGVYRAISETRTFSRGGSAGTFSGSLTFTIKETADATNNDTGSWTVSTTP